MKKIMFIFTLLAVIAVISSYIQSVQNKKADKIANQVTTKDLRQISNPEDRDSGVEMEYITPGKAPESIPGILLILTNDKSKTGGSTSFLWNLLNGNPGKTGC